MKVVIRRSVFETNSSSNHCLILTKKEDMEEKLNKVRKEYEWFMSVGTEENPIVSKEDKCYLLQGIFEEELSSGFCSEAIYDIFKQVLKDNNEVEILEKIENIWLTTMKIVIACCVKSISAMELYVIVLVISYIY